MLIWVVLDLASYAATLDDTTWDYDVSMAFEYLTDFFMALSLFAIMAIAKASVFSNGSAPVNQPVYNQHVVPQYTQVAAPQQQQQYAYVQPPQQYPYQQPPQPQQIYQPQTPYQQQQQQFTYRQQSAEIHNGEAKHELKS